MADRQGDLGAVGNQLSAHEFGQESGHVLRNGRVTALQQSARERLQRRAEDLSTDGQQMVLELPHEGAMRIERELVTQQRSPVQVATGFLRRIVGARDPDVDGAQRARYRITLPGVSSSESERHLTLDAGRPGGLSGLRILREDSTESVPLDEAQLKVAVADIYHMLRQGELLPRGALAEDVRLEPRAEVTGPEAELFRESLVAVLGVIRLLPGETDEALTQEHFLEPLIPDTALWYTLRRAVLVQGASADVPSITCTVHFDNHTRVRITAAVSGQGDMIVSFVIHSPQSNTETPQVLPPSVRARIQQDMAAQCSVDSLFDLSGISNL